MGSKISTNIVIKYCAYEVSNNGYTKRTEGSEEECTANKILNAIENETLENTNTDNLKDYITKWMDYLTNQTGEYFSNIKTELEKSSIDETKIGLIASSFASYEKFLSFNKSNELEKASSYLGEEGDSITIDLKDHRLVKSGNSKFSNGNSNKWYLYKFHDFSNNVIMWFSDHDCEFELKHSNKISCLISKLSEYNGVKQTTITKVKFLD